MIPLHAIDPETGATVPCESFQAVVIVSPVDRSELVTIDQYGRVTIHRDGGAPEAARLFWGRVAFYGMTHVERIMRLERDLFDMSRAPYRRVLDEATQVHGALPDNLRGKIRLSQVSEVLRAAKELAIKEIQ